jgi:hypothetical protein
MRKASLSSLRANRFFNTKVGFLRAALVLILIAGFSFISHQRPAPPGASIFASTVWNAAQSFARSDDGVWQFVEESAITSQPLATRTLRSFSVARLDQDVLANLLSAAPLEFTPPAAGPVWLSLPMPEGNFGRFRIEESPVMQPALAAQFPEVKSYRGQGVDDPSATARFDWGPNGFYAIVLSANGSAFIAPYTADDKQNYISFNKEDLQGFQPPQCEVTEAMQDLRDGLARKFGPEGFAPNALVGATLRTYRLALATTVEYTNNATYGGTKSSTLTKLNTIVNLINAIYEREVSIRFQLVASELSIIFDTEPDGYTNSSVGTMLNENPTVLNATIGSAAYDIGHVFGLSSSGSSSGVAQLAVVCGASKGRGASVLGIALVTGNFSIDSGLVAHEWGHQFSASHTFNSISNFCGSAGQRNASTAYEPGSGSTLMAYPGVCSLENLQSNSDNYFMGGSFDQIASYSAGSGNPCAAATSTGNNPPAVSAGLDYTVPMGTPFTLTASASDPDGDSLTYSWEELDTGTASPPMTDDGTRPLFRSLPAVTSPSRTFPKLSSILNNTSTIGETLPTTTRTMNFRATARDNRAAGGGVNSDSTSLSVTFSAGPFSVTQPNTALSWPSGSLQTITWAVANTDKPPVNIPAVEILLSTDGGLSFPVVIASSTPNDGSHPFFVPNVPSSSARIKVEAIGNIFFDISNSNFTITQSCPATLDRFSQSFTSNGGAATMQVTAAPSCIWTAISSDTSVATITSGGVGNGNGQVGFTVSVNTSTNPRSAMITIGSLTFKVLQGARFTDVTETHLFYNEIGKLSARGVTVGCGGGNYCPDSPVTREQMAAFIIRAMGDFNPPQPASQRFADVPPTNQFYAFIELLAVRQITVGCGGANYCPSQNVTREQMAAFIIRALGEYNPPVPDMQRFNDVPPSNPFYAFIDRMAVKVITLGCSAMPPLYCPSETVTRGQMAAFLVRAFNL